MSLYLTPKHLPGTLLHSTDLWRHPELAALTPKPLKLDKVLKWRNKARLRCLGINLLVPLEEQHPIIPYTFTSHCVHCFWLL